MIKVYKNLRKIHAEGIGKKKSAVEPSEERIGIAVLCEPTKT